MITAQMIADALKEADDRHPRTGAWLDTDDLKASIIDGEVNLEDVAEVLNRLLQA